MYLLPTEHDKHNYFSSEKVIRMFVIYSCYIYTLQESDTRIFVLSMYSYHARLLMCQVRNNI